MVRSFIRAKMDWIKQHRPLEAQAKNQKTYETGEQHAFLGVDYPLEIIEIQGREKVKLEENVLYLFVNEDSTAKSKEKLLAKWYRKELEAILPSMFSHWENVMNLKVAEWRIKSMKTKWGTCNITKKRIWLNLELIKKTRAQLEYVLVHEMVHLFEKYHNKRFYELMSYYLPNWKSLKEALNTTGKDC